MRDLDQVEMEDNMNYLRLHDRKLETKIKKLEEMILELEDRVQTLEKKKEDLDDDVEEKSDWPNPEDWIEVKLPAEEETNKVKGVENVS